MPLGGHFGQLEPSSGGLDPILRRPEAPGPPNTHLPGSSRADRFVKIHKNHMFFNDFGSWDLSWTRFGSHADGILSQLGESRVSQEVHKKTRRVRKIPAGSRRGPGGGRLAEAGPKSEVSEPPKETLASAGEEDWLHPCRIVKIIQKLYVFRLSVTLRDSSWRALEAIPGRFGRY